jgi:hypothetical protein
MAYLFNLIFWLLVFMMPVASTPSAAFAAMPGHVTMMTVPDTTMLV